MTFLQTILVALDGSAVAERALDFAIELSHQYDSELILCSALDYASSINAGASPSTAYQTVPTVFAEYESATKSFLEEALARTRTAGARASTLLLEGRPVPAILAAARLQQVDAIVLGTSGKRDIELMVLGSTADGVLRLADVPTFVVNRFGSSAGNAATRAHRPIQRILVAFDDSDPAIGALHFAVSLGSGAGSVVICCSAVATGQLVDNAAIYGCDPAPYVREAREAAFSRLEAETKTGGAAQLRHIERIIVEGYAPDAVLAAAAEHKADIIVCGSHGRRGIRRLMLGSVAESLIRRSAVPVAVVRKIANVRG